MYYFTFIIIWKDMMKKYHHLHMEVARFNDVANVFAYVTDYPNVLVVEGSHYLDEYLDLCGAS